MHERRGLCVAVWLEILNAPLMKYQKGNGNCLFSSYVSLVPNAEFKDYLTEHEAKDENDETENNRLHCFASGNIPFFFHFFRNRLSAQRN